MQISIFGLWVLELHLESS